MSSTNVEVIFEGPAVKEGSIDARLLADSLLGYSEVFTRANVVVNGEVSQAAVLVQSDFRHGSFVAGLEFVQNVTEQAQHLITAHEFLAAAPLAAIIGFLPKEFAKEFVKDLAKETVVGLFKRFKGKKPDEVKPVDHNTLEVRRANERVIVNNNVFNLYGDSAIRAGLDKLTRPLREAQIDRIKVRQEGHEEAVIEKAEAEYFEAEPLALTASTEPMAGERDAVLLVAKLSFKEGTSWTFFERGATVVAKIKDEEFWKKVEKHEIVFGKGDLLKVRLAWEVHDVGGQVKSKNTIVKVLEKIERPKQMRLDGKKDDDLDALHPRRRRFREDL